MGKLRNVLGHLTDGSASQVKAAFRAAKKLDSKQGDQNLEQLARWLSSAIHRLGRASSTTWKASTRTLTDNAVGLLASAEEVPGIDQPDRPHPARPPVRRRPEPVTMTEDYKRHGTTGLRPRLRALRSRHRRIIGYDPCMDARAHLGIMDRLLRFSQDRRTQTLDPRSRDCQRVIHRQLRHAQRTKKPGTVPANPRAPSSENEFDSPPRDPPGKSQYSWRGRLPPE